MSSWNNPVEAGGLGSGSFRERHEIALQSGNFLAHFQLRVDLVKVGADAEQNPSRCHRRKMAFLQTVIGVQQIFDAIGFRQKFPAIEGVDVKFALARLIAANEMAGQTDARHWQFQTARDK